MSLSRIVMCESRPWNGLTLFPCRYERVWIKNRIYSDEENIKGGYEKLFRYDKEKMKLSEIDIGPDKYQISDCRETEDFLYLVRKLSLLNDGREPDIKSFSLVKIDVKNGFLQELICFDIYPKPIKYIDITKVFNDRYVLLEVTYYNEEGNDDTRRNSVLVFDIVNEKLTELIDDTEDEFYEYSYGMSVRKDRKYFFLVHGEEKKFDDDLQINQPEIEIFEMDDFTCTLIPESRRLIELPKEKYWTFDKITENGKLLFKCKVYEPEDQTETSLVEFDVENENSNTICAFEKGFNIKSTFYKDNYVYAIIDNSSHVSDNDVQYFKRNKYRSMIVKSTLKGNEENCKCFDLNVNEEVELFCFNVFGDKVAVFRTYDEEEVDGYFKRIQKVYTYDMEKQISKCIYTTYDCESDPYAYVTSGRDKTLVYIIDMLPESNLKKNLELYSKYNLAPLTPEMIFEFELD